MKFKINKFYSIPKAYAVYYFYQIYRFKFNKILKKELKSINQNIKNVYILYDAMFDNPLHWWKLAVIKNFYDSKFRSIGLVGHKNSSFSLNTIKIFNFNKIIKISISVNKRIKLQAENLAKKVKNKKDLINLNLPFGYPAYHIYDTIIKRERLGTIDRFNYEKLVNYLLEALIYLEKFDELIKKNKIKYTIVSHKIGIPSSTLSWISVINNIPVFMINHYNGHSTIIKINNKSEFLKPTDDCFDLNDFSKLKINHRKILSSHGEAYLNKIRNGIESEVQRFGVYRKNSFFEDRESFINQISKNIDIKKKIAVIMANAWPDFPNQYGTNYYPDFIEWIKNTLEFARINKNCTWIIKPHPAEKAYGDKIIIKNELNLNDEENIFFCPDHANGRDLIKYCDFIISARGTSTIEYSALGKVCITCFDSPFSNIGFSYHAKSIDEYKYFLSNIHLLKEPDKEKRELANIFAASFLADLNFDNLPKFPFGDGSFKLFSSLEKYISKNNSKILNEKNLIIDFLNNKYEKKFNVYKIFQNINIINKEKS